MRTELASTATRVTSSALVALATLVCGCVTVPTSTETKEPEPQQEPQEMRENLVESFEQRRDDAQLQAAIARWQQNDLAGCVHLLNQLLDRNPDNRRASRVLADAYLEQENFTAAEQQLRQLLASSPEDAATHHALGMLLEASERQDEASQHFRRASELEPENELYRLSVL